MARLSLILILVASFILNGCTNSPEADDEIAPPAVPIIKARPGDKSVYLEWQTTSANQAEVIHYNIYWSTQPGAITQNGKKIPLQAPSTFNSPSFDGAPAHIFEHTQLVNGLTYYYVIAAIGLGGESYSPEISVTPQSQPDAPNNLIAVPGDQSVELSWNPVPGANQYNIYLSQQPGIDINNPDPTKVLTVTEPATSRRFADLNNDVTYYFVVTAEGTTGESEQSAEVATMPQAIPEAPIITSAIPNDGVVQIEWNAVPRAQQYFVYASIKENVASNNYEWRFTTNTTSFLHSDLTNGTTYYYVVTAANLTGESGLSNVMSSTPQALPSPPQKFVATARNKSVQLDWQAVPGAKKYTIYIARQADVTPDNHQALGGWSLDYVPTNIEDSSFLFPGLQNGLTYYFVITVNNETGTSKTWSSVSAIPSALSAISAGGQHACIVRTDHTLWCWGNNSSGQLGDGSLVNKVVPIQIGGEQKWQTVASGENHTCALTTDRALWCWGNKTNVPVNIDPETKWFSIAAGKDFSCGLKAETAGNSLWCWGDNTFGQLGDGTQDEREAPTLITNASDWRTVTAGSTHACGLKADGTLWCWGRNNVGQLGLGNSDTTNILQPMQVGNESSWNTVKAADTHTCATKIDKSLPKTDKSLWCWGENKWGQLGNGSFEPSSSPAIASITEATDFTVGNTHSCAIKTDLTLWCWGRNHVGQLGNGTQNDSSLPIQINSDKDWVAVVTGLDFTCASNLDGAVLCWGYNKSGQLGNVETIPLPGNWQQVALGGGHSCGIRDGALWCWGNNLSGELGDTTAVSKFVPTLIDPNKQWQNISLGNQHSCGLKADKAFCWGNNQFGQLGVNSTIDQAKPTLINENDTWTAISAGFDHVCAIKTDGTLWCWGKNNEGQLGIGGNENQPSPRQIDTATNWLTVNAGDMHTCAIKSDGSLWCWGNNSSGQLGNETLTNSAQPIQVGNEFDWQSVNAAATHTCASKVNGSVWCWGGNADGQLGNGTTENVPTPLQLGNDFNWHSISSKNCHSCSLKQDKSLWCWGDNTFGQLGDKSFNDQHSPILSNDSNNWKAVATGWNHTCAIKTDDTLHCWGKNWSGELGDGTAWKLSPHRVQFSQSVP